MSVNPQYQALNQQVTALQHQIQNAGGTNTALHQDIVALKNDISANKNSVVINDRLRHLNDRIRADQHAPRQPAASPAAQPGHYQAGHYQAGSVQGGHFVPGHYEPGHMQPGGQASAQNAMHPMGPAFSQNQNSQFQYGLRKMSATLNIHPKF